MLPNADLGISPQWLYQMLLRLKALGLKVAGVDLLQSSRGPLIIEVNASPGLEGIEKATGKDIAGEIISFLERNVRVPA